MLSKARLLVRVACGMEIATACLFLIVPVLVGLGGEEEFTILLRLVGVGLILHGIIGLVVASFMTWYVSTKQIIYLIISGILLLLPTLIEGFHFNLFFCFSCFLYIYAAVRCIKHNKKAQEEVREEREREEALNNE
ncbi:hypothetical protein ACFP6J_000948 [Listeria monocytogenes]|uniref:hypothetical protein n=1 Tax=Listeria monocytogenes TaxID=1639 RepID=UPI0008736E39|nr:hypothetical protein [Listeria monocytogenes]OFG37328.1 hypothetical protein BJM44_08815 [Listeria monocytogenes]